MKIPDKEDWEEAWTGLDAACAFKNFYRKELKDAIALFEQCALIYQEDLAYMPELPFKYYVRAYTHYLLSEQSRGDSDGGSCFLSLIKIKLRENPDWLDDSWAEIERVLRKLATEQTFYDASPSIYGAFPRKVDKLLGTRTKAQNP